MTTQSADAYDIVLPDAPVPEIGVSTDPRDCPESAQGAAAIPPTTNDVGDTAADSSLASTSDPAGSSMDESVDNASARSESSEDGELAASDSGADINSPVPGTMGPAGPEILQHPLPERPPSAATNPSKDTFDESDISYHQDEYRASRESSAPPEAYEPPEPEADAQSRGSACSRPFSPALPESVKRMAASTPSSDLSPADEALTDAPQVSVSNPPLDSQTGVLDV